MNETIIIVSAVSIWALVMAVKEVSDVARRRKR